MLKCTSQCEISCAVAIFIQFPGQQSTEVEEANFTCLDVVLSFFCYKGT